MVHLLLNAGSDPNIKNARGESAFEMVKRYRRGQDWKNFFQTDKPNVQSKNKGNFLNNFVKMNNNRNVKEYMMYIEHC